MTRTVILEIIATLLMILFLYTAINKLMDYRITRIQLSDTPLIGPLAPVIAWAVPVVELATVVLLFIPALRLKGLYISFYLMLAFTVYVALLIGFSKTLPCSCGGVLETLSWKQHIVFNIVITSIAFAGIKLYKTRQSLPTIPL